MFSQKKLILASLRNAGTKPDTNDYVTASDIEGVHVYLDYFDKQVK